MKVLFVGKRFYTNRDALREKYGRIWNLPWHWAQAGVPTRLWLVDYHSRDLVRKTEGQLDVVSTPVRTLSVFKQYLRQSRLSSKPDVVVASGDCYIGLLAYRLARRLRARFVFDIYDKYDEFGAFATLPGFDPYDFLLRRADACMFASRALMERTGERVKKSVLVRNGIDTSNFYPRDMQACRTALGLPLDATIIGYFGSLDKGRGIDDLLSARQRLLASGSDLQVLIGGKPRAGLVLDGSGIHYLGDLPYPDVPRALACCDLLALPYRRSAYLDMASSCKIVEYMAMQRPIVATRTPNFTENFIDIAAQLGGLMAEPGDPADLARAILDQTVARKVLPAPSELGWDAIALAARTALSLI
ncbi:glycosyltransferase [Frateuria sp. MAH-13]|uniref:Glycosyltransferase n=1 Tax=Frateuria flava TaxID=2821489 RepID=A0ABS4DNN7_9GAMM|nr:glycosyltransferase [Frateuria flava]MBP1474672.1 glycosyltransferase [Frateuria flava]